MRTVHGLGSGLVIVVAVATSVAAAPQRQGHEVSGEPAARAGLERFDAAVADYLRMSRVPDRIDSEVLCLPEAATQVDATRLDELPPLREGSVFTPDLVALIHARIAMLTLPQHVDPPLASAVVVGARWPVRRSARPSKALLSVLPQVPDDLAYRLAGNDLLLLDLRTNVIVDVMRHWRER